MPEEQRIYHQWRDLNDRSKYPFSLRASLTNGNVSIAPETFLDARLYPAGVSESLHLSTIIKNDTSLLIVVGDTTSGDLASAEVLISDILDESIELLELRDGFNRTAGVLVTDPTRLGLLTSLPIGTHEFSRDQTEFAASVITPSPQSGVRSLVAEDLTQTDEVWLVGGLGVVLEHVDDPTYGDKVIIHVVGEPLSKRAVCQDVGFETPTFVQSLVVNGNVVYPDEYGDFKIAVCGMDVDDTILRVLPTENSVTFAAVGGRVG